MNTSIGPVKKDSDEDKAFRKTVEHVDSVLGTVLSATLPEGTDYHVFPTILETARAYSHIIGDSPCDSQFQASAPHE